MVKRKTTAQFIQDARKVHGDKKYDYSQANYVNKRTEIKIICPKHGDFWQLAGAHLQGKGCPSCGKEERSLSLQEFIRKSKLRHGDKYDYSQVKYVNNRTKVKIICQTHGVFLSRPQGHLKGSGCPDCAHDRLRHSLDSFIAAAKNTHGNRYDYSFVDYKNFSAKVKISCPDHGVFLQDPRGHLSGKGCPRCFGTVQKTKEQFILEAQSVHGKKYDYSQANYRNTDVKVKIVCPEHGDFWQTPYQHIRRGNACPCCSVTGLDYKKPTLLYFLLFEKPVADFWKVGITNHEINKRFSDHRYITQSFTWPFQDGHTAQAIESRILQEFADYRLYNPSLTKSGFTECFRADTPYHQVIDLINSLV